MNAFTFSRLRAVAAKSPITLVCQVSRKSAGAFFVFAIAMLVAGTNIPAGFAQAVTYAGSGAVGFGSVNVCPAGKTTPAPCSKTLTLTYNVTASGTLGTAKALTTGAQNLDYKLASGSTCSGSVVKGNTCKVNVTFVATQPGARNGAVEIVDSSGNTLVTTYVYGTGAAPKIGFSAPATRSIGSGSEFFGPAAVDGSGNIFVSAATPPGGPVVVEELLAVNGSVPSNPAVRILADNFSTSSGPQAFAIDGAGNVFFTVTTSPEQGTGYVEELLAADSYATMINLPNPDSVDPDGIAVDGSGNVFVSSAYFYNDYYSLGTIYELSAADGYTTATTLASSSDAIPAGIALDTVGNLFVLNYNSQNVLEYSPSDGYSTARTINAEYRGADGYTGPYSIAVDPAGDLFGALNLPDQEPNSAVVEYYAVDGALPANPTSRILEPDVAGGLSFDSRGNLYATQGPNGLEEVELSTPSAFSFDQTQVGHTSQDSPKSMLVQNQGNAALDLTGLSLDSSNWELVKGSGTPCSTSTVLATSALCNLSISFEPKEAGALTGAVSLTDNSLDASGSTQSIELSGTAVGSSTAPHISSTNTNYAGHDAVVIIDGTNFGATQGSSKVTFNGIATPHYYWGSTQIYVTVPYNATSGNLVVTVEGQASNAIPFTVLPEPEITGISPTSGPAGTVVTISGTDLLDYENKGTVTFDGKSLPIVSDTSSAIKVTIPVGAVSGYFHVLINDTGMNTSTFTVKP